MIRTGTNINMRTVHYYREIRMEIVMQDMKGAKIHVFESGSDSRVAKTFRWHYAYVPTIRAKAKKFIDEQLSKYQIVLKQNVKNEKIKLQSDQFGNGEKTYPRPENHGLKSETL